MNPADESAKFLVAFKLCNDARRAFSAARLVCSPAWEIAEVALEKMDFMVSVLLVVGYSRIGVVPIKTSSLEVVGGVFFFLLLLRVKCQVGLESRGRDESRGSRSCVPVGTGTYCRRYCTCLPTKYVWGRIDLASIKCDDGVYFQLYLLYVQK